MEVRLLGPIEVVAGGEIVRLPGEKQPRILALLALRLGETVASDRLIDAAWGEDLPADPANALQYQIAQLRRQLAAAGRPDAIRTEAGGYALDASAVDLDTVWFNRLFAEARASAQSGQLQEAAMAVERSLELWRGPALGPLAYEEFAQSDADRLEADRLAAEELRVEVMIELGKHRDIIPRAEQLASRHPHRERLGALLMTALYREGRQPDALRAYQRARDALAEIGLEPGVGLSTLEQRILDQDPSLAPPLPKTPMNVPAPIGRLIGREAALVDLDEVLGRTRLVTLTGPGGTGKTRLAIELAGRRLERHPDGVWMVRLDRLETPSLVAAEIGRAVGMREDPTREVMQTLTAHLARSRALVILDNCEHLADAVAAVVEELLADCPHLTVLSTSQVRLGVPGEHVVPVEPLVVPGATASVFDRLEDVPAVQLFLERAEAAGRPVRIADEAALAGVANIVAALDGVPLAIELAAARVGAMSIHEIAEGLRHRFDLLQGGRRTGPSRQQSLRGAVEWSVGLLDRDVRDLLFDLSVFAGGFDIETVAAVVDLEFVPVASLLAELVDRSLVQRIPDVAGRARFSLLETVRLYGRETLESDSTADVRNAHLSVFADLVEQADAGLRGREQLVWLDRLDADYENVRAALGWSLDMGDLATGMRLAASVGWYWDWKGYVREASEWLGRLTETVREPVPGLASVLGWRAYSAWELGDLELARSISHQAIETARDLDSPAEMAAVLTVRMLVARADNDFVAAMRHSDVITECAQQAEDPWMTAWAASGRATVAIAAGRPVEAAQHARLAVQLFSDLGDERGVGWGCISLAEAAHATGDHEEAAGYAAHALEAAVITRDDRSVAWLLELLAANAADRGDPQQAARLLGAANPLRERRGLRTSLSVAIDRDELAARLAAVLPGEFEALVAEGRRAGGAVVDEVLAAARG